MVCKPFPHSAIPIGFVTDRLALPYFLSQRSVWIRLPKPLNKAVVSASGYPKKAAQQAHNILSPMEIDDLILDFSPHFLSVSRRKFRILSLALTAFVCADSSSLYGNTPCCSYLPTSGGVLSLSVFTGPVHFWVPGLSRVLRGAWRVDDGCVHNHSAPYYSRCAQ